MAMVRVLIVHDEIGRIISIARPSGNAKVIISSGHGQSVLETDAEEGSIIELAAGGHRVDVKQKSVISYARPTSS